MCLDGRIAETGVAGNEEVGDGNCCRDRGRRLCFVERLVGGRRRRFRFGSAGFYVLGPEFAVHVGTEVTAAITNIAERTNELVDESWLVQPDPLPDPLPARIRTIAFNAAVRVASNPKGLTSWTRSWDDITRTERIEGARRLGLYLTDEELAELNGTTPRARVVKSIRMVVGLRR